MAFEDVSQPNKYFDFKKTKPNTVLFDGYYVGQVPNQKYGGVQHVWKLKDGSRAVVGAGRLDYLYDDGRWREGDYCRVTFLGQQTLSEGKFKGKPFNDFKVEVDQELSLAPVATAEAAVELSEDVM